MNLDRANQYLQLAANVGVILSILFLAFQLSQNQDMMKAQTRNEVAIAAVGLLAGEAVNGDLGSIVRRSYDEEELSPDEQFRLERLLQAYFRAWENTHYQYRAGLYDEQEFSAQREAWRLRLKRPGVADFWCRSRRVYSTSFVVEIDAMVSPPCEQQPSTGADAPRSGLSTSADAPRSGLSTGADAPRSGLSAPVNGSALTLPASSTPPDAHPQ